MTRRAPTKRSRALRPKARKTSAKKARARRRTRQKVYATFSLWLADQLPGNQRTIRALRRFVRKVAPNLKEAVKWGSGCWLKAETPVCYVETNPVCVRFGFLHGTALADPHGLLAGRGKHVRHVTFQRLADLDEDALAALLREAIA